MQLAAHQDAPMFAKKSLFMLSKDVCKEYCVAVCIAKVKPYVGFPFIVKKKV